MIPLCLDVETLPLEASLAAPYDPAQFNPPANYKSDEAIAGFHARNEVTWRAGRDKACSVNPRLGRILAFGHSFGVEYAMAEADEAGVLRTAWDRIQESDGRVVTWNGGFDLRFLVVRSLANGVAPSVPPSTVRSWFKKYDVWQHFDVKAVLMNWDVKVAGEGLDEWSKFFGLAGKPDGIDGSAVAFLYREGQHDDIKTYCASDVANTAAMYAKLVPFFGGDR